MKDYVKTYKNTIVHNKLHAKNEVTTKKPALSINFIKVDDETLMMTVAFMKSGVKTANTVENKEFAQTMSCIEEVMDQVDDWYGDFCKSRRLDNWDEHQEYFRKCQDIGISRDFCMNRKCHKLFFIPICSLWEVCKGLSDTDEENGINTIGKLWHIGIYEISVAILMENKVIFNTKFLEECED